MPGRRAPVEALSEAFPIRGAFIIRAIAGDPFPRPTCDVTTTYVFTEGTTLPDWGLLVLALLLGTSGILLSRLC